MCLSFDTAPCIVLINTVFTVLFFDLQDVNI